MKVEDEVSGTVYIRLSTLVPEYARSAPPGLFGGMNDNTRNHACQSIDPVGRLPALRKGRPMRFCGQRRPRHDDVRWSDERLLRLDGLAAPGSGFTKYHRNQRDKGGTNALF